MNIIDLFAGSGGFSTGFEIAGFKAIAAVEIDEWAAETYNFNHPFTKLINKDIRLINYDDLSDYNDVFGIIGGPPCQGFSLSGKRDPKDPRNSLFMEFVKKVNQINPLFFVMENVPGLLSMRTEKKEKVIDLIIKEFNSIGYKVAYKVLNAAEFGVPQIRNRVFIIGIPDNVPKDPEELFPDTKITQDSFVTIAEAIYDLPRIQAGEGVSRIEYTHEPTSDYQKWIRKGSEAVFNHIAMKHTQRLIDRFNIIKQGQSLKDVPKEHMQRKRGNAQQISGKIYSQNNMRPFENRPSPTIAASFQSNYIHPRLNRNFTAREAARLQSFPDKYVFKGKRTTMSWEKSLSQYQQIGNAVPPLLAKEIALKIKDVLKDVLI